MVFEGLDNAGKSTQIELLRARTDSTNPLFVHMPSGATEFTMGLYALLENQPPSSGLGRQLAHLSCHSETMPMLLDATASRALILDRWWWSTVAYGWYGGDVQAAGITESVFRELVDRIWTPISASIVFMFLSPHSDDPNNVDGVAEGYRSLAAEHEGAVVIVPELSVAETHEHIVLALNEAGLVAAT